MKKLLLSICCILAMGTISISLTSCNGCTEEAVSRMYDADFDLDGDGDYGDRSGQTDFSFKGKEKCNEIVGCNCTKFVPKTDGNIHHENICDDCKHHRRNHP